MTMYRVVPEPALSKLPGPSVESRRIFSPSQAAELVMRSTGAGLSIPVPVTLSRVPKASSAAAVTFLRSPRSSVVASAGSRLPPTDTAELVDETPAIQQLVQRLGKKAGEARSFGGGQRQVASRRYESSARALRSDTPPLGSPFRQATPIPSTEISAGTRGAAKRGGSLDVALLLSPSAREPLPSAVRSSPQTAGEGNPTTSPDACLWERPVKEGALRGSGSPRRERSR